MASEPATPLAISIRRLTQSDVGTYRPLRLEALRLHPQAFSSDFAAESQLTAEAFAARMPPPPGGLFGGFVGNQTLGGMAGLVVQPRAKLRHKGQLVGMYVAPPHRRSGLAAALVQRVIAEAHAAGLHVLWLGVTVGNEPARQLYTQHGFRRYGVEADSLCVDGCFYDEELMALRLA